MRTIAILSQKGGAGKTTLALHLAAAGEAAGLVSLIVDMDPQATASKWAEWRQGRAPEVIDSPPALLPRKLAAAEQQGAQLVVIDTPPHAEAAAYEAAKLADLILIPCRPRAFDLDAIQMTAALAKRSGKPAYVVFMAGPVRAAKLYEEAAEVVRGFGVAVAPVVIPERAGFHHSTGQGRVASELDPNGKAAEDVAALWAWTCERVNMTTSEKVRAA
jgi:chromosome partitioning protein